MVRYNVLALHHANKLSKEVVLFNQVQQSRYTALVVRKQMRQRIKHIYLKHLDGLNHWYSLLQHIIFFLISLRKQVLSTHNRLTEPPLMSTIYVYMEKIAFISSGYTQWFILQQFTWLKLATVSGDVPTSFWYFADVGHRLHDIRWCHVVFLASATYEIYIFFLVLIDYGEIIHTSVLRLVRKKTSERSERVFYTKALEHAWIISP